MVHFGDPDWYELYVEPMRAYYTQADKKQVSSPHPPLLLQSLAVAGYFAARSRLMGRIHTTGIRFQHRRRPMNSNRSSTDCAWNDSPSVTAPAHWLPLELQEAISIVFCRVSSQFARLSRRIVELERSRELEQQAVMLTIERRLPGETEIG